MTQVKWAVTPDLDHTWTDDQDQTWTISDAGAAGWLVLRDGEHMLTMPTLLEAKAYVARATDIIEAQ